MNGRVFNVICKIRFLYILYTFDYFKVLLEFVDLYFSIYFY